MPKPIRGAQIATGADGIATANLVDGAATTAKIDALAVTTAKIAAGAVTDGKVDSTVVVASGANAFSGDQSMGNNKLTNVAAPTVPSDGARLADVQAAAAGLKPKDSVRVRAQGNVVLAAPGANIDGVAMVVDQRFLADQQAVGTEDGFYLFKGAATPAVRTPDAQVGATFAGVHVFIEEGTDAEDGFVCTNDQGSDVVGTDDLNFTIFSRLGFGVAPVSLGNANAEGASSAAARANHVHARDIERQESVTAETINTDAALADNLNFTPVNNASIALYLNGIFQSQGAGEDYTVSGTVITWLAGTGTAVNLKASDTLKAKYISQG